MMDRREARQRGATLAAIVGLLTAASGVHARTGGCAPVHARLTAALDPAWRDALDALVHATAQEGLPWSCPGGFVEIEQDPSGGAVITVYDVKGRSASRH